jgi:hypothetical protein
VAGTPYLAALVTLRWSDFLGRPNGLNAAALKEQHRSSLGFQHILDLLVQSRNGTLARLAIDLGTKEASLVLAAAVLNNAGWQALAPLLLGWRLASCLGHQLRLHSRYAGSRASRLSTEFT